jgi:hypothetical protein
MLSPTEILRLARAYSAAEGVALSTVGKRVLRNNKIFQRISAGGGANTSSLAKLELFFRANWPKGAKWPADIVPGPREDGTTDPGVQIDELFRAEDVA